jgi:hypothetical protein
MSSGKSTEPLTSKLGSKLRILSIFFLVIVIWLALASTTGAGDQNSVVENLDVLAGDSNVDCSMLDNPIIRQLMSAMFETKLLTACDRKQELGRVGTTPQSGLSSLLDTDVQVNDSSGDSGSSHTQSETSIALNEDTGTLCSGYNDSYHGVVQGQGYTGFSRSIDSGATFTDGGGSGEEQMDISISPPCIVRAWAFGDLSTIARPLPLGQ